MDRVAGRTEVKPALGVWTLALLNVAAVLSIRNLPSLAEYGWSAIFYLTVSALCFFIPSALVSAELASGWPQNGGVYLWVREAFGPRWGFVAIAMQWLQNLPWFPAALTFVAAAIAYVIRPELATDRWFVFITINVIMWAVTLANFKGMRFSAFLSSSGAVIGTMIPGILIILLGVAYMGAGKPVANPFSWPALLPDLGGWNQWMLLAGILVGIAGMEMSAVHVTEVNNPRRNFPRAIFISCVIIILLSALGSLSISLVLPAAEISLDAGAFQAVEAMFRAFNLNWLTPVVCFLLAYGAITMAVTWVIGPAKGVLEVAKEGYLPSYWQYRNRQDIPTRILILQAAIVSLLSLVVFFMPNISSAFWIMSALTVQLYMIMYLLMFAAAIKLRYSRPDTPRPYRIPGGKPGIWLVAGVAFLSSLLAFAVGFIPTDAVRAEGAGRQVLYVLFLVAGVLVFTALPLILYSLSLRKKKEVQ